MDDSLLLHLTEWRLVTQLPTRDAWRRLSAYESSDLVRRLLKERHDRSPNAGKALEVAAHVTQGRQYFEAAASAAILTRPLLLYYGVLSLSRAVILCADVARREATLAEAHGLSCTNWAGLLGKDVGELPRAAITITGGTFTELAHCTMNRERSLVYSHSRLRSPLVQDGTETFDAAVGQGQITLKDVLARIPDLAGLFQTTFNELGACYPAYVEIYRDLQTNYYLLETRCGLPSIEHLRHAFGLPQGVQIESTDNYHVIGQVRGLSFLLNRNTSPDEVRELVLPVKNDVHAFPYVVEPFQGGVRLSTLSLLFMTAYAMGMLVRYHPSHWATLAGPVKGNSMFPLLSAAARLVERRFPELVLDELEQLHPGARSYRHPSLD